MPEKRQGWRFFDVRRRRMHGKEKADRNSPDWQHDVFCDFHFSGTVQLQHLIKRLIQKEIEQKNYVR